MRVGTLNDLRMALGYNGQVGVSESFACALKKASGVKGRKFDINLVIKWWRENPGFKMSDVYPRKKKENTASAHPCSFGDQPALAVGISLHGTLPSPARGSAVSA
jgi:hypothetical protein